MTRFFVDPGRITSSSVEFDARDSHHLAVVLKRRTGDTVLVCDGKGTEFLVVLDIVSKTSSIGRITDMYRLATEPTTKITVAQALPKTLEKLEWVLQHGTELGAIEFLPFYCARSREDWQRLTLKKDRWQEIVRSAAEQSRRAFCPQVKSITSFEQITTLVKSYDMTIFAYENETDVSLRSALGSKSLGSLLIVIGPEGGFTEIEQGKAIEAGAISVTLGPRILRTETVALCMLSQILFACENI
jgi:16S rRNA (uracil1498-N3)-methyltransferase